MITFVIAPGSVKPIAVSASGAILTGFAAEGTLKRGVTFVWAYAGKAHYFNKRSINTRVDRISSWGVLWDELEKDVPGLIEVSGMGCSSPRPNDVLATEGLA